MYDNMIEFVTLNDDDHEVWEIDYDKKIALNISDLSIVKDKVSHYTGTIENFSFSNLNKVCLCSNCGGTHYFFHLSYVGLGC